LPERGKITLGGRDLLHGGEEGKATMKKPFSLRKGRRGGNYQGKRKEGA